MLHHAHAVMADPVCLLLDRMMPCKDNLQVPAMICTTRLPCLVFSVLSALDSAKICTKVAIFSTPLPAGCASCHVLLLQCQLAAYGPMF